MDEGELTDIPESPQASDAPQLRKLRRQVTTQSAVSNASVRRGSFASGVQVVRVDSMAYSVDGDSEAHRPLLAAMNSMGASHNASMAAATMATAVAPAAMAVAAATRPISPDALPDTLTELQKHTQIVRERRRLRRQNRWRAARIQIYFVLVVVAIAAALHFFESHYNQHWRLLWLPAVDWVVMLGAAIPVYHAACFAADTAVSLLEAIAACMELDNVHYVIFGISPALRRLTAAAMMCGGVTLEFLFRGPDAPAHVMELIEHACVCVIVFANVNLAKLLVCRIVSLRVNSEGLFETMQDAIEKETTLNLLMHQNHKRGDAVDEERIDAIATQRSLPPAVVPQYLNDLYTLAVTDTNPRLPLTLRLLQLCDRFQSLPESAVLERASHAAEYCWLTLRQDPWADTLTPEDLRAVMHTEELTERALRSFDADGDGSIQEPELHERLQRQYKQRRNLALTLYDNDEVINSMRSLVGAAMHIGAIFAYLYVFNVDLNHIILTLSSTGIGLAVVFGNSMRAVYESMVFLFVVRPFQVGDCILYAGERHWVRNFSLLTTLLSRFDGCQVWVSNEALMKSEISNLSDSDDVVIRSDFVADAATVTAELCTELEERLLAMMMLPANASYFRVDFKPICNIQQLQEPHKFLMGVCYKIAATGDDYVKVWAANTRVNAVVGQWQAEHNLIVSATATTAPPQPPKDQAAK